MHFKHPELLYALFLLVIPVLVHLFQLRRFRKEYFTNVKFLKKAVVQTRKSARIKKWLILLNRLLLLACIIIAFAQPYLPPAAGENQTQETIIYLDNSLSMQAKGKNGILLKQGIQQLLENLPREGEFKLFTNNTEYVVNNSLSLRKKLQQVDYSSRQLPWKTIRLKVEEMASEPSGNFIAISDFQQHEEEDSLLPVPGMDNYLVPMRPQTVDNISLDSMYVSSKNADETTFNVILKNFGKHQEEIQLSVFNGLNLLLRKTVRPEIGVPATIKFSLPVEPVEKGRLSIGDNGLSFDNELFFSINPTKATNVVVIGSEKSNFLRRIFTEPEFSFNSFSEGNVDFNLLSRANLVILDEPVSLSQPLITELQKLHQEQVLLAVIPSAEAELDAYNSFLRGLGLPILTEKVKQERLITDISFSHPLYRQVFDEEVSNFQYPSVQEYFRTNRNSRPVLGFNNGEAFLMEEDNIYLFSAPLNKDNSNFQGSPLIVPTFYNMGNLAVSTEQLYYVLGEEQVISLPVSLQQDNILKLVSGDYSFIPRQQSFQNKVHLFLEENIDLAGHYQVLKDSTIIKTLALNLDRDESNPRYRELNSPEGFRVQRDIPQMIEEIRSSEEVAVLWKWFVIFALVFLLTEMLILKFFK